MKLLATWLARLNSPEAWRTMLCVFAGVLLVFGAIPIANALLGESIKDYELWHQTGQRVLHGEPIYPAEMRKFPFMYPPTAALLLAPVSLLGQTGLITALVLVNAVAWTAAILLAVRLATGSWQRQHLLLYLVPSMVISVFAWSNFHLGQPSLLLLALMLGGLAALQCKREVLGGALFAFAASIKAFPFVVIIYLLYRRYWVAAASLVLLLAFLLVLLPTPFRGFTQARTDVKRWSEGMLFKYDEKGVAQRPGRSNSWRNQSIFGVANRMLRHVDADEQFKRHTPIYANFAELSFQAVTGVIVGIGLLLGLSYLLVLPRRDRRTPATDAIEFALLHSPPADVHAALLRISLRLPALSVHRDCAANADRAEPAALDLCGGGGVPAHVGDPDAETGADLRQLFLRRAPVVYCPRARALGAETRDRFRVATRAAAANQRSEKINATRRFIFDAPRTRSRKAIGTSRTRNSRPPRTMASNAILKPVAEGASASKCARRMAKKPHIESCTPVSG